MMRQKEILKRAARLVGYEAPYSTYDRWNLGNVDRRDRAYGKIADWVNSKTGRNAPRGRDNWIGVYMGGSDDGILDFTFIFRYPYSEDDQAPQVTHTMREGDGDSTDKAIEQILLGYIL